MAGVSSPCSAVFLDRILLIVATRNVSSVLYSCSSQGLFQPLDKSFSKRLCRVVLPSSIYAFRLWKGEAIPSSCVHEFNCCGLSVGGNTILICTIVSACSWQNARGVPNADIMILDSGVCNGR